MRINTLVMKKDQFQKKAVFSAKSQEFHEKLGELHRNRCAVPSQGLSSQSDRIC